MSTKEKIDLIKELIKDAKSNRAETISKKIQRVINSIPMDEYLLYEETLTKLTYHEKPSHRKATKE